MVANSSGLRLIFAGTPTFAAHHLQALMDSPYEVVGVYTQPDRPAGRGKKLTPSPVKQLALSHGLPVFQPQSLKDISVQQELAELKPDVMIVVAYGLILPKSVLDIPRYGCLNAHGSILPRWRGAAPIQRAIAAGDTHTGVTIMQMDTGLDTGDMLLTRECDIEIDDTSASLHDKLMHLGGPALLETLRQLQAGELQPITQDDALATYAEKITKEEASIDWSQSAEVIHRCIRAYNPFPVAYSFLKGERLKIYAAELTDETTSQPAGTLVDINSQGIKIACDGQLLTVTLLQLPGKKPMSVAELINGHRELFETGCRLGE